MQHRLPSQGRAFVLLEAWLRLRPCAHLFMVAGGGWQVMGKTPGTSASLPLESFLRLSQRAQLITPVPFPANVHFIITAMQSARQENGWRVVGAGWRVAGGALRVEGSGVRSQESGGRRVSPTR